MGCTAGVPRPTGERWPGSRHRQRAKGLLPPLLGQQPPFRLCPAGVEDSALASPQPSTLNPAPEQMQQRRASPILALLLVWGMGFGSCGRNTSGSVFGLCPRADARAPGVGPSLLLSPSCFGVEGFGVQDSGLGIQGSGFRKIGCKSAWRFCLNNRPDSGHFSVTFVGTHLCPYCVAYRRGYGSDARTPGVGPSWLFSPSSWSGAWGLALADETTPLGGFRVGFPAPEQQ